MNTPECRIYTAKVLSNGRLLRWTQAATYGEMEPEGIHQITGDTLMRQGEHLLNTAKIALVTPDVVVATADPLRRISIIDNDLEAQAILVRGSTECAK